MNIDYLYRFSRSMNRVRFIHALLNLKKRKITIEASVGPVICEGQVICGWFCSTA